MTSHGERIRRFTRRHIVNHWLMLITFLGLVATGLPQKYAAATWAKGVVLIIGGVSRVRFIHHALGTIMALQLLWAAIEGVWLHLVRRRGMPMLPALADVRNFFDQVKFNVGLVKEPPAMDRYTFAEKIEYLALVWGTIMMVATGLILLYPVRWSTVFPGEWILAAKAAHGGEALLAFLSILTWHFYFVHVRHWNNSIFTGSLDAEDYAEEHPLELARIRRGETAVPAGIEGWRVAVFLLVAVALIGAAMALMIWLRGTIPGMGAFRLLRFS